MIYNVALKHKRTGTMISVLSGYDGRPLRFTELRYAELAAKEKNDLNNEYEHIVIREQKDLCNCEEKNCLSYL